MTVVMVRNAHRPVEYDELNRMRRVNGPISHWFLSRIALSLWGALRDTSGEAPLFDCRQTSWMHCDSERWLAFAFDYEETYGLRAEQDTRPRFTTRKHHYQDPIEGWRGRDMSADHLANIAAKYGDAEARAQERSTRANAAAVRRKARDPDCHIDYLSSVYAEKTRDGRKKRRACN